MANKTQRIIGWILSVLGAVPFLVSGGAKIAQTPAVAEGMAKGGLNAHQVITIGIIEVIFALLTFVPRVSFLGLVLLTAFAGGAVFAHFSGNIPGMHMPIIFSVLTWIGWSLRHPHVIQEAFGAKS